MGTVGGVRPPEGGRPDTEGVAETEAHLRTRISALRARSFSFAAAGSRCRWLSDSIRRNRDFLEVDVEADVSAGLAAGSAVVCWAC